MNASTHQPIVDRYAHSISQTLEVFPIGRTKLYELLDTGAIRSIKVGRRRLIVDESLRQFIEGGPDDTAA